WSPAQGIASSATTTTDAQGYARIRWSLGTTAGAQSLQASHEDLGASFTATAAPAAAATVTLSSGSVQLNALGALQALSVTAADAHGNALTDGFSWTSSDPAVATVSASGLVTAQGA